MKSFQTILFIVFLTVFFPFVSSATQQFDKPSSIRKPRLSTPSTGSAAPSQTPANRMAAVELKLTNLQLRSGIIRSGSTSRMEVKVSVKNKGVKAAGRYLVKLYYSARLNGGYEKLLKTFAGVSLRPNMTKNFASNVNLPPLTPGSHYIEARVVQSGSVKDTISKSFGVIQREYRYPKLETRIITVTPERPMKGENVRTEVEIKNTGRASAQDIIVTCGFYRTCSDGAHVTDVLLQRLTGQIAPGASRTIQLDKILPQNAPSGNLQVRVNAKISRRQIQDDDCRSILAVEGNLPDLTVEVFKLADPGTSDFKRGDFITLEWRVKNAGTAASNPGKIYFRVESTARAFPSFPALEPQAREPAYPNTRRLSFQIPESVTPGRVRVSAYAQQHGAGGSPEINSTNNTKHFFINVLPPEKPDLIVDRVDLNRSTVSPGDTIQVTYSARNIGPGIARLNPDFVTKVFLSERTGWDRSMHPIDTFTLTTSPTAGPDTMIFRKRFFYSIPVNKPPGQYYIVVRTDIENSVDEVSATNNMEIQPIQIISRPAQVVE